MKQLMMTGNEAIARGFYEAGGKIATSYPGSPTVQILEAAKQYEGVYGEFSTNEKVALEVAIGGSFAGVRSMVSMKHVGVNIAADPLMTFTETPTNGGFVLISGDDPGLKSSQNEQDNRVFGKFANMLILDPSDAQDAKDFAKKAFDLSEKYETPVMIRITSRLCHSRSIVNVEERLESVKEVFKKDGKYCMIPPNSNKAQYFMKDRVQSLADDTETIDLNKLEAGHSKDVLIITSGLPYVYVKELGLEIDVLKLGMVYPLSKSYIEKITSGYKKIVVIEEMMPFIQNELKLMGIESVGKEYFSFTGELDATSIHNGLLEAGLISGDIKSGKMDLPTVNRQPLFCAGCPHRPIFDILKKSKAKMVIGDIGCYSLGVLSPTEISHSIISMGASVGITKGIRKAMSLGQKEEPIVSLIGDGTFFHSGIPSFINLLHQQEDFENMTFLILDNRTTAMTGGQHNGGSGNFNEKDDLHVDIKSLLETIGFKRVIEVDQYDYKATKKIIDDEIGFNGLSIVIAKGQCALKYKVKKTPYYVDPEICIACKSCIRTNCPPLKMKKYDGIEKMKSSIDEDMCVGCGICAQVCPVGAIKLVTDRKEV
ncbi:indolepyruvate ferredoxin oxidoreductase [Acidaminobacter sp. JC074]|uniref:thiamine pyrophosphate-dependent enzyme n=1 Tax=Acidaminobacter sp. JC074 TaxID=2530199 RepID=UPI001F0E7403|nr:thiamine pyrophosphate-dependent enzyme [Acidaminobacter sp. JC074]MCH4886619.1 indolepyruvate ferredoxin oxidoreductase [Acidaminobacter sp. JC074]